MLKRFIESVFGQRMRCDKKRHHVIISGTGRAGTTFLVSLLSELGLDTGFRNHSSFVFAACNAGLERDIRKDGSAYIVKAPQLCDHLGEALQSGEVVIDHAFIPVRDLYSAAESRRDVSQRNSAMGVTEKIKGGLWGTADGSNQEMILTEKLYNLVYQIAKYDIPLTLLSFPRIVVDPAYLFGKLRPVFPSLKYRPFLKAFRAVSKPTLVHTFDANQAGREAAMMSLDSSPH